MDHYTQKKFVRRMTNGGENNFMEGIMFLFFFFFLIVFAWSVVWWKGEGVSSLFKLWYWATLLIPVAGIVWFTQTYANNNQTAWEQTKKAFIQDDADECLEAAHVEFRELIRKEEVLVNSLPLGDQAPEDLEEVKAEKAKAKERFWLLHGFFGSIGLDVRPSINDYSPEEDGDEEE